MSPVPTCSLCDSPLDDPVGTFVKTFGAAKYRLCGSCRANFEREMQRYSLIGEEDRSAEQRPEVGGGAGSQREM